MDYSTHRTYRKRPIMMAVLMVLVGIITIQHRYDIWDITDWRSTMRFFSGFVLIVFGLLILNPRFRELMPAVGLMCFGIGLSRLIIGLSYSIMHDPIIETYTFFDNVMWVLGYVILFFSLYQIYRGFNFMRWDAMNAFFMRFTSMGIVMVYTLVLIYAHEFIGLGFENLWNIRRDFFTTPVLYLMYFVLLCSKEVYDHMSWENVRKEVYHVASKQNPAEVTVTSADLAMFRKRYPDQDLWDICPEDCPVERKLSLPMNMEGPAMEFLLEKWRGSGEIRYSFIPREEGYIAVLNGRLTRAEFTEDSVQMYGERYLAIQATVHDEPPRKNTLMEKLFGENDEDEEIKREAEQ